MPRSSSTSASWFVSLLLVAVAGCSGADEVSASAGFGVDDRAAGDRTPLTRACDEIDDSDCLLPWPSDAFLVADPATKTGLRVHVDGSTIADTDDLTMLNLADGFSRVTPLVTSVLGDLDELDVEPDGVGPVRLLLAQHDDPERGTPVPLRMTVQRAKDDFGAPFGVLFAYPLRPLKSNADYVAVVLDELPMRDGTAPTASHGTRVALGLEAPTTLDEAKLAAFHAPTRALLAETGIAKEHVVRAWSFTTRSEEDPLGRLSAMREAAVSAVARGEVTVTIDHVETDVSPPIAAVVLGTMSGLPSFVGPGNDALPTFAEDGTFVASGTRTAPFRVVVPEGTGDYPFVMFGHGLGGSYDDDTLDDDIAGSGVAKVGIQWDGLTDEDAPATIVGLANLFRGVQHGAALLMQAVANGSAVQSAMTGAIGDALAASTLGGAPNPVAGRRPDASRVMWVGGSLGGIMGFVAAAVQPEVRYGVLNVPGAAWTHFVAQSSIYTSVEPLLRGTYGKLGLAQALAMSQGEWDEVDGAAWAVRLADRDGAFLVQESIGDPVVPNSGSEMMAVVTGATQVGAVIVPIAAGVPQASEVRGGSGVTQYKVAETDPAKVHGFASRDSPAGAAAREQIAAFVTSVLAGAPTITVPSGCAGGSCDFSK